MDLVFPVPPQEERYSIAQSLNRTLSLIEPGTTTIRTQLDILTEDREALITAAVSREIDANTCDSDRNLEAATP